MILLYYPIYASMLQWIDRLYVILCKWTQIIEDSYLGVRKDFKQKHSRKTHKERSIRTSEVKKKKKNHS